MEDVSKEELAMRGDHTFEMDRGTQGKIKVNLVSLLNALGILGILLTAIISGYSFFNQISRIDDRLVLQAEQMKELRSSIGVDFSVRDRETRGLRDRTESIGVRLSVMETQLTNINVAVSRLESRLERSGAPK